MNSGQIRSRIAPFPTLIALAALVAFSAGASPHGRQAQSTSLEGTWIAESMVRDGQAIPKDGIAQIRFIFQGNSLTTRGLLGPTTETKSSYMTDNSKRPRHIDFKLGSDATIHGLYELSGDKLQVCFPRKGGERPAALESPKGTATILLSFSRDGK